MVSHFFLTLILSFSFFFSSSFIAEADDKLNNRYEGVGTCASSSCHGSVKTKLSSFINQNEYQIWFNHDAHSLAYKDLFSSDSKKIAEHLGISNPEKDSLCLSCHATYVESELRGERFKIEDGVGCESCHGPAENYLKTHTLKDRSHQDNVTDGMNDLSDLELRANVCLDCHIGNKDKEVNHKLIGSGHPRLSFELDTYGVLQPKHWSIDKDYTQRKGSYEPYQAFLVGQVQRALRMLDSLSRDLQSNSRMPELSNYYCYSCHHSLSNEEWKEKTYDGSPGELRLNLSSLIVLSTSLSADNSSYSRDLVRFASKLAHETNGESLALEIKSLRILLSDKIMQYSKKADFSTNALRDVVRSLVKYSIENKFMQYEDAEQFSMGVFSCLSSIDPSGKLYRKEISELHKTLQNEKEFNSQAFSEGMNKLEKVLK